jgi:hypothetical protein
VAGDGGAAAGAASFGGLRLDGKAREAFVRWERPSIAAKRGITAVTWRGSALNQQKRTMKFSRHAAVAKRSEMYANVSSHTVWYDTGIMPAMTRSVAISVSRMMTE